MKVRPVESNAAYTGANIERDLARGSTAPVYNAVFELQRATADVVWPSCFRASPASGPTVRAGRRAMPPSTRTTARQNQRMRIAPVCRPVL